MPQVEEETFNLSKLNASWPQILKKIDLLKPTLTPLLSKIKPQLSNNKVTLDFAIINNLQFSLLEKNKAAILKCMEDVVDYHLQLEYVCEVDQAENIEANQVRQEQQSKEEIMNKIRSEGGELISKIIDDFDLEVV